MEKAEFRQYADLLERARNGDDEAFREIYRRTKASQIYHLKGILGSSDEVKDALQEVYALLYQNMDKINPPTVFVAYINRLSYYVARNMERKQNRRDQTFVNLDWLENLEGEDQQDALKSIEKEEKLRLVRDTIDSLPNDERSVIFMRYFQKLSHQDIAISMGITMARSKRIQHLAQKHLRTMLEKKGIKSWGILVAQVCGAFGGEAIPETLKAGAPDSTGLVGSHHNPGSTGLRSLKTALTSAGGSTTAYAGAAAACLIAAAAGGRGLFNTPEVKSIEVTKAPSAIEAKVDINIDSTLPVNQVTVTGENGNISYGIRESGSSYRAVVQDNGTYEISIKTNGGKTAADTVRVDCIDRDNPKVQDIQYEGDITKILFAPDESGVEYDSIYCTDNTGATVKPISTDPEQQLAIFRLSKKDHTLYFEDKAGNMSEMPLIYK